MRTLLVTALCAGFAAQAFADGKPLVISTDGNYPPFS